jgi:hypothetical protein
LGTLKGESVVSADEQKLAILQSILGIFQSNGIPKEGEYFMRCRICDCILTDTEAVAKDENGKFLDICEACLYEETDPWQDGPVEDWLDPDDFSPDDVLTK